AVFWFVFGGSPSLVALCVLIPLRCSHLQSPLIVSYSCARSRSRRARHDFPWTSEPRFVIGLLSSQTRLAFAPQLFVRSRCPCASPLRRNDAATVASPPARLPFEFRTLIRRERLVPAAHFIVCAALYADGLGSFCVVAGAHVRICLF